MNDIERIYKSDDELHEFDAIQLIEHYRKDLELIDSAIETDNNIDIQEFTTYRCKILDLLCTRIQDELYDGISDRELCEIKKNTQWIKEKLETIENRKRKQNPQNKYHALSRSIKNIDIRNTKDKITSTLENEHNLCSAIQERDKFNEIYNDDTTDIDNILIGYIKTEIDGKNTDLRTRVNLISHIYGSSFYQTDFAKKFVSETEKIAQEQIDMYLRTFNLKSAEEIESLLEDCDWFDSQRKEKITSKIDTLKQSKEVEILKLLEACNNNFIAEDYSELKENLEKAENGYSGLTNENNSTVLAAISDSITFWNSILKIIVAIQNSNVQAAEQELQTTNNLRIEKPIIIEKLKGLIFDVRNSNELKFNTPQILVHKIDGFNVPKREGFGEDSDPFDCIDNDKSWGVISVFDGMGGAGARKYIHDENKEEHTSAYWASRFVRQAVEQLICNRPVGEQPTDYIELNLHEQIKRKLDAEIKHFPSESTAMSKMIRKLPTTMALCSYFIEGSNVNIKTYWAGDSRIYLFDLNSMSFLTIDDASAPDNDPFSPANMDLAMNNAISQDREFRINKSEIILPLDESKPFVLLACSDGCFGYFRNPIEFETMVRKTLKDADDWKDWSDRMKQAIIDNGQSDDISMVGVAFGVSPTSFDEFKRAMQKRFEHSIFEEFQSWKEDADEKLINLKASEKAINAIISIPQILNGLDKIDSSEIVNKIKTEYLPNIDITLSPSKEEINAILEKKKSDLDDYQIEIANENNDWYLKYKPFISVIEIDKISSI
ncbi:MAG: hypothetical protein ACI3ZQ_03635 [Candidatus Cryptobacteroides sp.]